MITFEIYGLRESFLRLPSQYQSLISLVIYICDPSARNESHVGNFRKWVLYTVLKITSLALKWHQNHGPTFLLDKVMTDYVSTLWKLIIREKHIESLSILLDGMKCK